MATPASAPTDHQELRATAGTGGVQCRYPEEMVSGIIRSILDFDYSGESVKPLEEAVDREIVYAGVPLWSRSELKLERVQLPPHMAESVGVTGSVDGRTVLQAIMVPVPVIPAGWDAARDPQPTEWHYIAKDVSICVKRTTAHPDATMPLPPDQWR